MMWLITGSCNLPVDAAYPEANATSLLHILSGIHCRVWILSELFLATLFPLGIPLTMVAYEPRTVIEPAARSPIEFMHIW